MLRRILRRFQRAGLALLGAGEQPAGPATSPQLEALGTGLQAIGAGMQSLGEDLASIDRSFAVLRTLDARRDMIAVLAQPRYANPLRLEPSGFKVHSQYDEDGIIGEIFRRIGALSQIFIEFGAGDGGENCTAFLLVQGWRGLWIEPGERQRNGIQLRWRKEIEASQLTLRDNFITADTIDAIIRDAGFSGEIDLLVVDIDGNDYHVLQQIQQVSPRVVCVEYNANFPPSVSWVMPRGDAFVWDGLDYRSGGSLKAFETMMSKRGYALVGCSFAGVNAFFVRKDLVAGKFAEPFTAENHYNPHRPYFVNSADPHKASIWRGRLT